MIAYLKAVKELKDDLKEDSPFDYETYYKALKTLSAKWIHLMKKKCLRN